MSGRPVALVTGSRRGIGRAIAVELGRAGFDVALTDAVASDELDQAVAEVEKTGAPCDRGRVRSRRYRLASGHAARYRSAARWPDRLPREQRGRIGDVARRSARRDAREFRSLHRREYARHVLSDPDVRQTLSRPRASKRRASSERHHDHVIERGRRFAFARRILRVEGRPLDGEHAVCAAPRRAAASAFMKCSPA